MYVPLSPVQYTAFSGWHYVSSIILLRLLNSKFN